MIPAMFMPSFMRTLSNLSPVKWAILSLEGAIWRGFTFGEFLLPYSILLGFGIVCMMTGIWRLNRDQQAG